jgi:hypothetical protein
MAYINEISLSLLQDIYDSDILNPLLLYIWTVNFNMVHPLKIVLYDRNMSWFYQVIILNKLDIPRW